MWLMSAALYPRVLKHFNEVNNIQTISIVFQSLLCNTCNNIRNWTIHSQAVQLKNKFKVMIIFVLTHFSPVSRENRIFSGKTSHLYLILCQDNKYQSIRPLGMIFCINSLCSSLDLICLLTRRNSIIISEF